MDGDQKMYWIMGGVFVAYLVLAYFFPIISWIIIAAGICCWFGGS